MNRDGRRAGRAQGQSAEAVGRQDGLVAYDGVLGDVTTAAARVSVAVGQSDGGGGCGARHEEAGGQGGDG